MAPSSPQVRQAKGEPLGRGPDRARRHLPRRGHDQWQHEIGRPSRPQRTGQQWIRVAVLDSDARPRELAQLELRLQVRDPLRDPYKLSNELLFVEEMAREYGQSDEQVAMSLGWSPSRPAIGKRKVELWRRILVLIREMQRR